MSISEFGALIITDPETAKARVLGAIEAARGDRKAAADALRTTHRSLYRYIERLRLWGDIDEMIRKNGFPLIPGPPRSSDRIRDAVLRAKGSLARAATILETDSDTLRDRIAELELWDSLNAALEESGGKLLKRPEA